MATFISHLPPSDYDELEERFADQDEALWTIHGQAVAGDRIIFYVIRPVSSFVGWGTVVGDEREEGEDHGWPGHLMGYVEVEHLAKTPLHIRDAKAKFPSWGWLRNPQRSIRVPDKYELKLLTVLSGRTGKGKAGGRKRAAPLGEIRLPS